MTCIENIKESIREIRSYRLPDVRYEIKLDQNENPHDLPASLKHEICSMAEDRSWSRYPHLDTVELREALSRYTGVNPDGIVAGNGSNEIIQALCMAVNPDSRMVIPTPTFTLYRLIGAVLETRVVEIFLKKDYTFDEKGLLNAFAKSENDILLFPNPNNPTGCLMKRDFIQKALDMKKGLVVVDEAYYEFSGETVADLIEKYHNLVVLRTYSKAFSMAGLRIGYGLMQPALAEEIDKVTLPYNLNFFTITAAIKVLDFVNELRSPIDEIIRERERLYELMKGIAGITVYPSHANFLLFETVKKPVEVFKGILEQGIIIRDVSSYPMLKKALRVSIGLPEENDLFYETLKEVMKKDH